MNYEREYVIQKSLELSDYREVVSTIDDLIDILNELKDEGYTHINFEEKEVDAYDVYFTYYETWVVKKDLETDKEYKERIKREKYWEDYYKNKEIEQYRQLKEKYGDIE